MRSVGVSDLEPGMILARSIINDDMLVVLSEGTLLTKAHITRLGFLDVPSVYIKDEYELNESFQTSSAVFNPASAFVTEYKEVISTAKEIFGEVARSGRAPVKKSREMAEETIAPLSRMSGAIDYLLEVNHLAGDVYNHSVRVSVLSGVIAKWLFLPKKVTYEVILSGFLHDIGKTRLTPRLIDRRYETLHGEDLDAYIQHTIDGQHILASSAGLSDGVKLTAMQHHETMDGSGFPFGIQGGDIHPFARIVAVADIYDNITTEREGYRKETPFAAVDLITQDMYTRLDPKVCVPFLKHIKEAFLGSRVLLSNGLMGTIVRYTNDYAGKPLIRITNDDLVDLNAAKNLKIIEYNPR